MSCTCQAKQEPGKPQPPCPEHGDQGIRHDDLAGSAEREKMEETRLALLLRGAPKE